MDKLQLEIDELTGDVTVRFETKIPAQWMKEGEVEIIAEVLGNRLNRNARDLLAAQKESQR